MPGIRTLIYLLVGDTIQPIAVPCHRLPLHKQHLSTVL